MLTTSLAVLGCAGGEDDRPAEWAYLHAAVIRPGCATAGCHSDARELAGLSFEDPDASFEQLLGERFVVPGDPHSPLMQLLTGDERTRMPPDAPLPAADVELVRRWILEGASR